MGLRTKDNQNEQPSRAVSGSESGAGAYNNRRLEILKLIFWIALVVAVGMFAFNQTLDFFYKMEFLKSPCMLCGELNPEVTSCIRELNTRLSFPDGMGGWTDPFADKPTFNLTSP